MIAKATFKGEIVYGLTNGFEFSYYKKGVAHVAYAFDPRYPTLSCFTELVEIPTVNDLFKELSSLPQKID